MSRWRPEMGWVSWWAEASSGLASAAGDMSSSSAGPAPDNEGLGELLKESKSLLQQLNEGSEEAASDDATAAFGERLLRECSRPSAADAAAAAAALAAVPGSACTSSVSSGQGGSVSAGCGTPPPEALRQRQELLLFGDATLSVAEQRAWLAAASAAMIEATIEEALERLKADASRPLGIALLGFVRKFEAAHGAEAPPAAPMRPLPVPRMLWSRRASKATARRDTAPQDSLAAAVECLREGQRELSALLQARHPSVFPVPFAREAPRLIPSAPVPLQTEAHERSSRKQLTNETHEKKKQLTNETHERNSRTKLMNETQRLFGASTGAGGAAGQRARGPPLLWRGGLLAREGALSLRGRGSRERVPTAARNTCARAVERRECSGEGTALGTAGCCQGRGTPLAAALRGHKAALAAAPCVFVLWGFRSGGDPEGAVLSLPLVQPLLVRPHAWPQGGRAPLG